MGRHAWAGVRCGSRTEGPGAGPICSLLVWCSGRHRIKEGRAARAALSWTGCKRCLRFTRMVIRVSKMWKVQTELALRVLPEALHPACPGCPSEALTLGTQFGGDLRSDQAGLLHLTGLEADGADARM